MDIKKRQSQRLRGHDYSHPGGYFVTICSQDKGNFLGKIHDDRMIQSQAGKVAEKWWLNLPGKFLSVELDEFILMPNHLHGILWLGDSCEASGHPTLGQIVGWFKSMSTNEYIRGVKEKGWPPFPKRFWQRNYHDKVLSPEDDIDKFRRYILENPLYWQDDPENPHVS